MNSRYWLLIVAWSLYLVSLFSPSATVPSDGAGWFDTETVVGWRAALWCMRLNLERVPVRTLGDALGWTLLWFWPLSNLLMLLTPLMLWLSRKRVTQTGAIVMGAATLANASALLLLQEARSELKVSYYLWCLSFAVATIGLYRHSVRPKASMEVSAT